MSNYTSFAVAGAGKFGSIVVQHLAAEVGISIRILSRSSSKKAPPGVEVVTVDYSSETSIIHALRGIEVVISTMNPKGLAAQDLLAKASKKAGIKLFVPSEFGADTTSMREGPESHKYRTHQLLRLLDLPYVLMFNGVFADDTLGPEFGFDWPNRNADIVGKGDTPMSFTTMSDTSRFLVHAITSFPPPILHNLILRVEGDYKSFNDAVSIFEATHPGLSINVTHYDLEGVKRKIDWPHTGKEFHLTWLKVICEEGLVDVAEGGAESNWMWKEWNPETVEDVLLRL